MEKPAWTAETTWLAGGWKLDAGRCETLFPPSLPSHPVRLPPPGELRDFIPCEAAGGLLARLMGGKREQINIGLVMRDGPLETLDVDADWTQEGNVEPSMQSRCPF